MNTKTPESVDGYRISRLLGEGATARVFLAHDGAGEDVALKVIRREYASHDEVRARFERESALMSMWDHPHIVSVLGYGSVAEFCYLVMPFVRGVTLAELIEQAGGKLPSLRVAELGVQLASALQYAHRRGVIHRDVKPENVLIDEDGRALLTDFGLALDESSTRLTQHDNPLGTPYTMAPEQWSRDAIDERTDVFALGVTLFNLLTGRLPFPGRTPAHILKRQLSGPHEPLDADVPRSLARAVDGALARDPDVRTPSASALERALQDALKTLRMARLDDPFSSAKTKTSPRIRNAPMKTSSPSTKLAKKLAALPIEIAEDTYWVGKRAPGEIFYANPYLRAFKGNGKAFNLIIDPGSSSDFSIVQSKVSRVIGKVDELDAIFINHQDPDVGSSVGPMVGRYTPNAFVLCTEDTWRLIQYYNIKRDRFIALEKYPKGFSIPTGHTLRPVPSPFCHFVGAMMLYDASTRVLFTGDLFGGLTDRDAQGLDADESDWVGMRAFHQIYMPTNKAVLHAIANIRALDPAPEVIAPQHGRVIRGEWIEEFMRRLEELPVGLDILDDRHSSPDELNAWSTVLSRILDTAGMLCDEDLVALVAEDPNLAGIVDVTGSRPEIKQLGKFTIERAVRVICDVLEDPDLTGAVKYEAIFATSELGLPTPMIEIDDEGGGPTASSSMLGS